MGWEQLAKILDLNREHERQAQADRDVPSICPIDGEVLEEHDGKRRCPMGNFSWPN